MTSESTLKGYTPSTSLIDWCQTNPEGGGLGRDPRRQEKTLHTLMCGGTVVDIRLV